MAVAVSGVVVVLLIMLLSPQRVNEVAKASTDSTTHEPAKAVLPPKGLPNEASKKERERPGNTIAPHDVVPLKQPPVLPSGEKKQPNEPSSGPVQNDQAEPKEPDISPRPAPPEAVDETYAAFIVGPSGREGRSGGEKTHGLLQTLPCRGLSAIVLSRDGRTLISSGISEKKEATLQVWNLNAGKVVREIDTPSDAEATRLALSPDGTLLAILFNDFSFAVIDCRSWDIVRVLPKTKGPFLGCVFLRDGARIALLSRDVKTRESNPQMSNVEGSFQILNVASGKILQRFEKFPCSSASIAASPTSDILASCSNRGVFLRDIQSGAGPKTMPLERGHTAVSLCFAPDGKYLAAGCLDGKVRVWDVENQELVHIYEGERNGDIFFSVQFSPDGRILAGRSATRPAGPDKVNILLSLAMGSPVTLWEADTGRVLARGIDPCICMMTHEESVAFSPLGKVLCTMEDQFSKKACIKFWDVSQLIGGKKKSVPSSPDRKRPR